MRITAAAQRLGTSPRMLRYRESLGLLPTVRERPGAQRAARERPGAQRAARERPGAQRAARERLAAQQPGQRPAGPPAAPRHRRFGDADLEAVALGLAIEQRYDISPAALAFGIRALADPRVRAEVAEFGRRIGRIQPPPARAVDFEQERALRLLSISSR
jgi:MerR family transcriptional regulator, copper efflux regulator